MLPAKRRTLGLALVVVLAVAFRIAIVVSWHAPAGDGWQYYRLSETLRRDGRYAYAPPPAPLAWSRLPGYPLFLAATAIGYRGETSMAQHVVRATIFNALFDVATALLVALMLWAEVGRRAAGVGFLAIVLCPILATCSSFALSESIATLLGTATVYLAWRAGRTGRLRWAVASGVALGMAQLVRVDTFTLLPALLVALFVLPWKLAARATIVLGACALLVWAPWPLRNLHQFGAAHPEGTEWLAQDGTPLPAGVMVWMRSWATGKPGEDYDLFAIANHQPLTIERPGIVLPAMYDDAAERAEVVSIFRQCNHEWLSAAVDARFVELGRRRAHAHPFRQWIWLPLQRVVALWTPIPPYELPFRVRWLGMPDAQRAAGYVELAVFLASLVALCACWSRHRTLLSIAALVIVGRTLLHSTVAHPCPTERYLVECVPFILLCGAVGIASLRRRKS